jgi:hypothetical protein
MIAPNFVSLSHKIKVIRPANGQGPDFVAPFAPAAETWARTTVLSIICTPPAIGQGSPRGSKKLERTRATEPSEPLPHTVPVAEFNWQISPG